MRTRLPALFWIWVPGSLLGAAELRVPGDFPAIQEALDAAAAGDTVLVAPGEYEVRSSLTFRGKGLTLRSEAGPEMTTIRMSSAPDEPLQARVFAFTEGEGHAEPAVLEGFTITGGDADGSASTGTIVGGGGVLCTGSSPTIRRCLITANRGANGGGVACTGGAAPLIEGCSITGNASTNGLGGGLYGEDSSPALVDCSLEGNYGSVGGGLFCRGSAIYVWGSTVSANLNGGIRCDRSQLTIEDSTIRENRGSGLEAVETEGTVLRCRFEGNSGSGMWLMTAFLGLTGCLLSGNRGTGADVNAHTQAVFTHCTIAGNARGGVYLYEDCLVLLRSSILWGNSGGSSFDLPNAGEMQASFSCIEGFLPGPGNISRDPLFCGWGSQAVAHVDGSRAGPGDGSAADPFRDLGRALEYSLALSEGSPCRGTGEGGADMGAADLGGCTEAGAPRRLVRLAPGRYSLAGLMLSHGASLEGSAREDVVVEGPVLGLRTGSSCVRLTVTGYAGLVVDQDESPLLRDISVRGAGQGVVCTMGSSPVIEGCTFSANDTALLVSGSPVVRGCTIEGNRSYGVHVMNTSTSSPLFFRCAINANFGTGVVIRPGSSCSFIGCTIMGNAGAYPEAGVDAEAGGVSCESASTTFINCLIAGNRGDGFHCLRRNADVSASLFFCTISGNQREDLVCLSKDREGCLQIEDSIVWGNSPDPLSCNLVRTLTTNPLFVRPGVFEFDSMRGPEPGRDFWVPDFIRDPGDYRLRPGSPAIDAGKLEGAPQIDLDGNGRPCGAGVDLGAYEACPPATSRPFRRADANGDGPVDLSDALAILSRLFLGGDPLPCTRSADVNDDGELDVSDPVDLLNHLFLGGPPPADPFQRCGQDVTADLLGCEEFPACS